MSVPSMVIEPRSGLSSPTRDLRNTDLPVPEGPSSTEISPGGRVRLTSLQMFWLPNDLVSPWTSTATPTMLPSDPAALPDIDPDVIIGLRQCAVPRTSVHAKRVNPHHYPSVTTALARGYGDRLQQARGGRRMSPERRGGRPPDGGRPQRDVRWCLAPAQGPGPSGARAGGRRGPARGGGGVGGAGVLYLTVTVAPAPSRAALALSAASLATFSRTGFGALSTRSLASLRPSEVRPRTSLMTWIFLSPAASRMTSNSSCSAAASSPPPPPPAAGAAATATGAAAVTSNVSSNCFTKSDSSRRVISLNASSRSVLEILAMSVSFSGQSSAAASAAASSLSGVVSAAAVSSAGASAAGAASSAAAASAAGASAAFF